MHLNTFYFIFIIHFCIFFHIKNCNLVSHDMLLISATFFFFNSRLSQPQEGSSDSGPEKVKRFLAVVNELGFPGFQFSDLEQVSEVVFLCFSVML